jgi:ADP-heptose:LPS heptosyltransferase
VRPLLLVLRALGLGDFATGVPALRAVRRAFPEHEIVLAAPAVLAPLVEACGAVDRLHPTPAYVRGPISRLDWSGPRPDVAVNLHGRGPQSHRALRRLRPARLLAFACRGARFRGGPPWSDDEHEVARWCRLLRWYGIHADPADLRLPAPAPLLSGTVVVHPGASAPERHWPAESFADVARALSADGYRVVLTGSADERPLAAAVAAAAGLPADDVLAGRTPLSALAAITAHARLVVCGDTGVAHLATAYGTPSVVLFGPMSPARWGPPAGQERHVALWHGPAGLAGIEAREVLAAARALLRAERRAVAAR